MARTSERVENDLARFAAAIEAAIGRENIHWQAADRARRTGAKADEDHLFTLLTSTRLAPALLAGNATPDEIAAAEIQVRAYGAVRAVIREIAAEQSGCHKQLRQQMIELGGDPDRPRSANDA